MELQIFKDFLFLFIYFFFKNFYLFILFYLFWAVLGLPCCTGFSLVEVSGAYSPGVMLGLLIASQGLLLLRSTGCRRAGFGSRGLVAPRHVESSRARD